MKKTISIVLVLVLGMVSIGLAVEDTWITKADIPTARQLHCTNVVDGKIYAIGGATSEPNPQTVKPVEVYDQITDSWTQKADIPTGRAVLATSVVDGKIYAVGGAGTNYEGLPTLEVYDPATDTWTRKADMPTPRAAPSASAVNGKLYVIGGTRTLNNLVGFPTVEEYDPATDTWTSKADMPTPKFALCTSVVDSQIYAIGGGAQSSPGRDIVEAYDPATDTWTRKANMPTARRNFATCVVGGRIYAIGGWVRSSLYAFTTVERYDPVIDAWTIETDLPVPRASLSASAVNGRIYAIGGTNKTHPCPALSTVYELSIDAPTPDFNGDGIVDAVDMCMMVDYWGTDEPLYDIAPPPFGDGIVDVQDLILLAEHLFEEIFPPELVSYWKLDEQEGDTAYNSINNNHGILSGNPTWQSDSGHIDGAIQLDGITDYINTDFVLDPANGAFSVLVWIKGGAPGQVIISQVDDAGTGENWLGIELASGKLMTCLVAPSVGRFIPQPLVSESIISDDQWHHVGFVWDGSFRSLYVDGVEVAKDTAAQNPLKSANSGLYIGAGKSLEAGTLFFGLIDDIRIYNKAMNADEIAALPR